MNEREFLKKLNSKANKDRDLTPAIVEELLSEGQALTVRGRLNILSRFLLGNWKKSVSEIIEDNFETILDRTDYSKLNVLLESLMKNWQTSEIVKQKFDAVIKRYSPVGEGEQEYNDAVMSENKRAEFYDMCRKVYTYADDLLIRHMDTIIQGGVTIEELKYLKGLSQETDEKLNTKLESQKQEVAKEMLDSKISLYGRSKEERQQLIVDYIPVITRIIEELLTDQNVRMVDIEQTGTGAYSKVYAMREKVLKIGKPRETYNIPNHPRILQPLTRTNLIDERDDNEVFACIEISERVDELSKEDLQVEKLYQLYKELREAGIIWLDARFSNVGKLRRKNIPKLNGEEMNVDPVAVGVDKEVKERILEAGDWVIIDTDFIYREGDNSIDWKMIKNSYSEGFERRWLQEKQGEVIAEYQKDEKDIAKEEYTKSYESRSWEKGKKREEEER